MITNRIKIVAGLFALVVGVTVAIYFATASDEANYSRLDEIFEYLGEANYMLITKPNYDEVSRKISNTVVLNSSDGRKIAAFLDVLKEQLREAEHLETSFNAPKIFTADYKVELACKRHVLIDFMFYQDNNAVCLRNEDYFFYAQFNNQIAETIKGQLQN